MNKCERKWIGWLFHSWKYTLHYPPMLSDGAGGAWAGHRVAECTVCHKKRSGGIWAAGESMSAVGGKYWAFVREARPDELKEEGIV